MKYVLNVVLGLVGVVIMFMGLNIGLAGIPTMGWLSGNEFILVSGAPDYDIVDNHIRFLGGLWFAVGVVFLVGGFKLEIVRQTLMNICLMIAAAGVFRFSGMDMELVFSGAIAPSLGLELIGFPLLAVWLWRTYA